MITLTALPIELAGATEGVADDTPLDAATVAAVVVAVSTLDGAAEDTAGGVSPLTDSVHELASCTRGSPFGPVTGVKVRVHVCSMGPAEL